MEQNNKKSEKPIFAKDVMATLESKKIRQIPRWVFLLKNIGYWFLWVLFIIVGGSMSVALIIFHILQSGWEYYPATHGSFASFLLDAFPYIWVILLVVFLIFGYEDIRQTKRGYRYAFSAILALSLFLSIVGGVALSFVGVGRYMEEHIATHIPFHMPPPGMNSILWNHAEQGLLAGTVLDVDQESAKFTLEEFDHSFWTIDVGQLRDEDLALIKKDSMVRVIGLPFVQGDEIFTSCFVFPWDQLGEHDSVPGERDDDMIYNQSDEIGPCKNIPAFHFFDR